MEESENKSMICFKLSGRKFKDSIGKIYLLLCLSLDANILENGSMVIEMDKGYRPFLMVVSIQGNLAIIKFMEKEKFSI